MVMVTFPIFNWEYSILNNCDYHYDYEKFMIIYKFMKLNNLHINLQLFKFNINLNKIK